MKLRNQLLALFCLLVFIGFGFLFFRTWVVQKPFGVILFVVDGLSTNTVTAARLYEGGASHRLEMEQFPRLALVRNAANDFAVPDTAAAASAIATGQKVNNRSIAINPKGETLDSLLTLARNKGRATGLVTTGGLTDATPAAFYAHTTDLRDTAAIAEQFLGEAAVDIALGGGLAQFTPQNKGGHRTDGRDLWLELRQKGYSPVRSKADLENTPTFLSGPLVGVFSDGPLAYSAEVESQQPTLSDLVRRAIEFLQTNRSGYLLVVDCEAISRAARSNDGDRLLAEMVEFDRALALARRYAGDRTLIIAVGKHEIGGMTLNGYPLRNDRGVALQGTNASGYPSITWSTGPAGLPAEKPANDTATAPAEPAEEGGAPVPPPPPRSEPAAYGAPHAIHTARDMLLIGIGPGSENIGGFMENTDVFHLIDRQL